MSRNDREAARAERQKKLLRRQQQIRDTRRSIGAKALAGPPENKGGAGDVLDGVEFASSEARDAAKAAGLAAESFKRRKKSGAGGFTVADVGRIAASIDGED